MSTIRWNFGSQKVYSPSCREYRFSDALRGKEKLPAEEVEPFEVSFDRMAKQIKPIETLYRGYRFRSRLEARWAVFFDTARIPWRYEEEGFDLSKVELPNDPEGEAPRIIPGEPETVPTGAPHWYLPDFYLPRQECWLEVKARHPSRRELQLMSRLVWATGKSGYIFWDLRPPKEVLRSTLPEDTGLNGALSFRIVEDPHETYGLLTGAEWHIVAFALDIDPSDEDPGPVVEMDYNNQWCECPRCGVLGIAVHGNARLLSCGCLPDPRPEHNPIYADDTPRLMAAYMAARQARFEHKEHPQQYFLQSKLKRIREVLDSEDTE